MPSPLPSIGTVDAYLPSLLLFIMSGIKLKSAFLLLKLTHALSVPSPLIVGSDKFEECFSLIKSHSLFPEALGIYTDLTSKEYKVVFVA